MARLTIEQATEMLRKAGAKPLEPYPGNQSRKWKSQCLVCSAVITPRVVNLKFSRACRYCRGHRTRKCSSEDLQKLLQDKKLHALEPYPGNTNKSWRCKCLKCGMEVSPMTSNMLKGQGGCWRCGRNYKEDECKVYLVHNSKLKAIKVGISNRHGTRLNKYPGWKLIIVRYLSKGKFATDLESKVLGHWRLELGLPPKLTRKEMPMKGWSETADDTGLESARRIIENYKENQN